MSSIFYSSKYYYLVAQFQSLRINRIRFFIHSRARFVILTFVIRGVKLYQQMLSYINSIRLFILLQNVNHDEDIVILEDVGHFPYFESPEEINKALISLIKK